MEKSVILVAGGSGSRMGIDTPKQFLILEKLPVLIWSIHCFLRYDSSIQVVVVLPPSQIQRWHDLCLQYNFKSSHQVVAGGETRFHSVKNGLTALAVTDLVAIHDGVRPLVAQETIKNCFDQAARSGIAIPVLSVNETIRTGTLEQSHTVDRNHFFTVQTPQVFQWPILKEAYNQPWDASFTDDASVAEHMGYPVTMVPGNRDNLKITFTEDLIIAGEYLKKRRDTL